MNYQNRTTDINDDMAPLPESASRCRDVIDNDVTTDYNNSYAALDEAKTARAYLIPLQSINSG